MKKTICFLLILMLGFSLVGCSSEKPESTVSEFLDTFISGNYEEAYEYIKDDSDNSFASVFLPYSEDGLEYEDEYDDAYIELDELDEAIITAYEKAKYEILNSTVDGDTAEVETKITVPNLGTVFSEVMEEAIPLAVASALSEDTSDEEMDEYLNTLLIDKLNSDDLSTVTKTVNISLVKENASWLIEMDDNLLDALSGNLSTIFDLLGE